MSHEIRANMYPKHLSIVNIAWLVNLLVQDAETYFTFGLHSVRKLNKGMLAFVASLILSHTNSNWRWKRMAATWKFHSLLCVHRMDSVILTVRLSFILCFHHFWFSGFFSNMFTISSIKIFAEALLTFICCLYGYKFQKYNVCDFRSSVVNLGR